MEVEAIERWIEKKAGARRLYQSHQNTECNVIKYTRMILLH